MNPLMDLRRFVVFYIFKLSLYSCKIIAICRAGQLMELFGESDVKGKIRKKCLDFFLGKPPKYLRLGQKNSLKKSVITFSFHAR